MVLDKSMLTALAARLYKRRHEAIAVPFGTIEGGEWQPYRNECHRNVTLWCRYNPQYDAVRGWIVADYSDVGLYKFFAHSVLHDQDGKLIDITPNPSPYRYPFLRHDPADGDFGAIVEGQGIVSLFHQVE
jgi:hypothetical protein